MWPKKGRLVPAEWRKKQRGSRVVVVGGGGVKREMLQLWGDKTTEQQLTCGCAEGGGGGAHWAAHSGIVTLGVARGCCWDAADKVGRNGSFPGTLTTHQTPPAAQP